MENKICVYAICKNEIKFADRWLSSLSPEADYIVVLDTGSTDGTFELLQNDSRVHTVVQKIITPWRFDSARNEAMKLIPSDATICVVADFDHIFRPGWGSELKKLFDEGYEEIYGDIIDYDDDNNELKRFLSKNVHHNRPEWYWERPIHEHIKYHGNDTVCEYTSDNFVIEHHPDYSKSRGSYLNLLETEYQENSTDAYCAIYYGCELCFHGREEEGHQVFLKGYQECDFTKCPEVGYQFCLNIAQYYHDHKEFDIALDWMNKAEAFGIFTRQLYVLWSDIYFDSQDYIQAKNYLFKAFAIKHNAKGWIEKQDYFNGVLEDKLAFIFYTLGDYISAAAYGSLACELNPEDSRLRENLAWYVKGVQNNV